MMEDEIYNANHQIQNCLGVRPVTFAYPCGQTFVGRGESAKSYIPLIARYFLAGRAVEDGCYNDPGRCDLANVSSSNMDGRTFETLQVMAETSVSAGAWGIFFSHDVGEGVSQSIHPKELDKFCGFLKNPGNKIWVDTVAAVAGWIQDERRLTMDFARI